MCPVVETALLPAVVLHLLEAVAVQELIAGVLEVGQWQAAGRGGVARQGSDRPGRSPQGLG